MKNYVGEDNFIIKYTIKMNEIYITYSDQSIVVIPYTKESINNIVSKMENQVRGVKDINTKNEFEKFIGQVCILFSSCMIPVALIAPLIPKILIISVFCALPLVIGSSLICECSSIKKDYEKSLYFLENKDDIQEADKIKKQGIILAYDIPFNINDVENYKLKELKEMREFAVRLKEISIADKTKVREYIKR